MARRLIRDIALDILVLLGDLELIEAGTGVVQQGRLVDRELRVRHMLGEAGGAAADLLAEG